MNKMFLEELPKWEKGGWQGKINWTESIGYKVKFIYEDTDGEVEIVDYDKKSYKLSIKYLDNDIFKIKTDSFKNCQLGKLLGIITNKFKIEVGTNFKDSKRDITITDKEYRLNERGQNCKWYKYKCNICGWDEGWMIESGLLKEQGCSCCTGRTVVEGINDIPTTAPWMIPYFQDGYDEAKLYTKSSNKKISPICPDCGRIKDKSISINKIYYRHSISCSCGDGISYPSKIMFNLLKQLEIQFETEYSPDWIKPKRYDFYIPSLNIIIETDGGWGHGYSDNKLSGIIKEESKEIDIYKDKLAKEHGIKPIRIDCRESELNYIRDSIFDSELSELLNLSNIDLLQCEQFALSNLVRLACNIKKENPNLSVTDIGEIMGFSRVTILKYIKKGSKLGWCDYNANVEIRNSKLKIAVSVRKTLSKKVVCLETDIIYNSISDAQRSTNIDHTNISACCKGKKKTSGGYHWMYYDDYLKQN